jgi:hypothetical protein
MSYSSSILRFVTDDPDEANESIASVLRRLCLLLEQKEIPPECYSCKNYSHSPYLMCAVNPARTMDEDCHQFELKALGWDSSEDNPANYSEN